MAQGQRESVEAIVRAAVEETGAREGMIIGEYVLIAAANGWDEDGDDVSQVVLIPDGSESRIIGLLEHARIQMRNIISEAGE